MKYRILQKVKGALFVVAILATLFLLVYYTEPVPKTKYIVAADGQYLPVYYVKTDATRHGNVVDIDYEDNIYSCYVDKESEVKTGDTVWAGIVAYRGNIEVVDIQKFNT